MAARLHIMTTSAPQGTYGGALAAAFPAAAMGVARGEISAWPGYAPTPLLSLAGLAREAGIGALLYKDEAGRFGLGSFKALGGAYGLARLLKRQDKDAAELTVCCATDGNHGRAVAWGARNQGCRVVIFLHEGVSAGREEAIRALGAEVRRVPGIYDDSLAAANDAARENGWLVVSDTVFGDTDDQQTAIDVMTGYSVIGAEIAEQLATEAPPSHLFVQAGVGGLAAGVMAGLWHGFGVRPVCVVCEPEAADCWFQSLQAGEPVTVAGGLQTVMACLACAQVSWPAWAALSPLVDAAMTIDDDWARDCMRILADPEGEDAPIVAGESAVAGIGGLLAIAGDQQARRSLGLTGGSRVLVIGSEGATDPQIYAHIVGRSAAAVRAGN